MRWIVMVEMYDYKQNTDGKDKMGVNCASGQWAMHPIISSAMKRLQVNCETVVANFPIKNETHRKTRHAIHIHIQNRHIKPTPKQNGSHTLQPVEWTHYIPVFQPHDFSDVVTRF